MRREGRTMNRLKGNTAAKVVASIVASVLAVAIVFIGFALMWLGKYGLFASYDNKVEEQVVKDLILTQTYRIQADIFNSYDPSYNYDDEFSENDYDESMYSAEAEVDGEYSTDNLKKHWQSVFNPDAYPELSFEVKAGDEEIYSNADSGAKIKYSNTILHDEGRKVSITAYYTPDTNHPGYITKVSNITKYFEKNKYAILVAEILFMLLELLLIIFLIMGSGRREDDEEIHDRQFIDHIPADLHFVLSFSIGIIAICLNIVLFEIDYRAIAILCALTGFIATLLALQWMMSFAVQIKQKRMIKETVIVRLCKLIVRLCKIIITTAIRWCKIIITAAIRWCKKFFAWVKRVCERGLRFFGSFESLKVIVVIGAAVYLVKVFLSLLSYWNEAAIIMQIAIDTLVFAFFIYLFKMIKNIENSTERILSGDSGYKIDTTNMVGIISRHANQLNCINEAIDEAVTERTKSEHLRTELITNVSHDIKTPLTSIINYTDLLAAEELNNEKAEEYIHIISSNAMRLKKLATDVVDASKASTGNIAIEIGDCNVGMMLEQALGEYLDRFEERNLTTVVNTPDDELHVFADGQHAWRILDNIMGNVYKYAKADTRVYIDVSRKGEMTYITVRNISDAELNISADELMERFVRGDGSRNTEGSGLGLSIAKNLAELQGGSLNLAIDGDLFKVRVGFISM